MIVSAYISLQEMKEKASTAFSRFMSYFIHTNSKAGLLLVVVLECC